MFFSRRNIFFYAVLCNAFAGFIFAQEGEHDSTTFRIVAEIGSGYSYKLSAPKLSIGENTRNGFAGTLRVKWGSSNLLGVGLETGYIRISSTHYSTMVSEFGAFDMHASLSAVPLLATFSIQRFGVQFHVGAGYYDVISTVVMQDESMHSSEWDMGFLASIGYTVPVSPHMRIGAELKWNNISEQQISLVSFQVRMLYRLFGE